MQPLLVDEVRNKEQTLTLSNPALVLLLKLWIVP